MIFLRSIERQSGEHEGYTSFPQALPGLLGLRRLEFNSPITFFTGENGHGRSTLLEAIALRAKLPPAAGQPLEHDPSLVAVHPLARSLRLGWMPRTAYGYFLRADDYFDHVREARLRGHQKDAPPKPNTEPPLLRGYALSQQPGTSLDFREQFGAGSDRVSFLNFLRKHSAPGGLHLIDEPEAALSPQGQLDFLALLKSLVSGNAQFIIATHSPVLLAYPGAHILCFDGGDIREVAYDELPQVKLMRSFLSDPEPYLRKL